MDKKLYDLMDWEGIEAIVYSEEDHPGRILGAHKVKGGILVHTFLPHIHHSHSVKYCCFPVRGPKSLNVETFQFPREQTEFGGHRGKGE